MDQTVQIQKPVNDSDRDHSTVSTVSTVVKLAKSLQKGRWLLGSSTDFFMVGGASIFLFAASWLFIDRSSSITQMSWSAYYLAIIVNNPHFMASYVFLYWDKRKEILSNFRFAWAALIAPLLLIGFMIYGATQPTPHLLGYSVNVMYFLVGWHYIKQIYGTIVVSGARQGYYFSKIESWVLKLNLYPVWFLSYFSSNQSIRDVMHYGIGYKTFEFPQWLTEANNYLLIASLVGVVYVLFRKWVAEGKLPGLTGLTSFAAIYVWYLPSIYHPHFWYLIPFFHSLQYMLFVLTLKKNQYFAEAEHYAATMPNSAAVGRNYFAGKYFVFVSVIVVLGLLTFKMIPEYLDQNVVYDTKIFGKELFMFMFITFINIHHYFIDNVIWRKDNQMVRSYL